MLNSKLTTNVSLQSKRNGLMICSDSAWTALWPINAQRRPQMNGKTCPSILQSWSLKCKPIWKQLQITWPRKAKMRRLRTSESTRRNVSIKMKRTWMSRRPIQNSSSMWYSGRMRHSKRNWTTSIRWILNSGRSTVAPKQERRLQIWYLGWLRMTRSRTLRPIRSRLTQQQTLKLPRLACFPSTRFKNYSMFFWGAQTCKLA